MLIKTSAQKALQTITDGNNLKEWNYKTSESNIVKRISDNELIIWMKNDFYWPVKNRDHVSRLKIINYKETGYRVEVISDNTDIVPRKRSIIRITNFKGYWQLIPKGEYVEITQQMYGDPKGMLPRWVINSVLTTAPYHSFYNLKQLLEK